MDFSLPIALRTRSQRALFYNDKGSSSSSGEDSSDGIIFWEEEDQDEVVELKVNRDEGKSLKRPLYSKSAFYGGGVGDEGKREARVPPMKKSCLENKIIEVIDVDDDNHCGNNVNKLGGVGDENEAAKKKEMHLRERVENIRARFRSASDKCAGLREESSPQFCCNRDGGEEGEETYVGFENRCLEKREKVVINIDDETYDQETKEENFSFDNRRHCIASRTRAKVPIKKEIFAGDEECNETSAAAAAEDNDGASAAAAGDDDNVNTKCEVAGGEMNTMLEGFLRKATKRKPFQGESFFKFFVNTIWEKNRNLQTQETVLQNDVEEPLPKKFNFGVEEPKPMEKSANDKLLDVLWDEMEFAMASCRVGTSGSSLPTVGTVDAEESKVERNPYSLCCQGKHDFILDDQIGIKCRACSFLHLEIKYVLPPIDTCHSERRAKKKYSDERDISMWEVFGFHGVGGGSQGYSAHGKGTVWDMFPEIRKHMYPHQQEGFEFLWANVAGGIEISNLKKSPYNEDIGGCVISHAPGTGKTFLTIAFLRSYMEIYKDCRPIIIAPCSLLLTWAEEFKKWKVDIPFHNLSSRELSDNEEKWADMMKFRVKCKKGSRMVKLLSWSMERSILGVSYPLFEQLAGHRLVKSKDINKKGAIEFATEAEEMRRILLDKPSLLVLDEGHTARNKKSNTWKALKNMKTGRRIILSGTPFQNNFEELYNTLFLVRPNFAGRFLSKTPTRSQARPNSRLTQDARRDWDSLTSSIGESGDNKLLDDLRALIEPFVHVHEGSILEKSLPGLRNSVIYLDPLPLQREFLEEFKATDYHLKLEHPVSLLSIHPSLLISCPSSEKEKNIIDKITSNEFRLDPHQGAKTRFLMELIPLCEALKEKVLVFSQFMEPFVLIKDQLFHRFKWTEGEEVVQIDGSVPTKHRQRMIHLFNDPYSKARVLLASTKTCREGINLTGASRVVLLDVVWNPSVEKQAICRAYRLGQKKVVYTYHLITSGTMEELKYDRQAKKGMLSDLVFSTKSPGDKLKDYTTVPDDRILEEMVRNKELQDIFKKIV